MEAHFKRRNTNIRSHKTFGYRLPGILRLIVAVGESRNGRPLNRFRNDGFAELRHHSAPMPL